MVTIQVPNFCTITEACKQSGFTYYAISYWLDAGYVRWLPVGTKRLIDMQDFDNFINGRKEIESSEN